jgi:hypothetical protein
MATIGLKHVVYSPLSESTIAATYTGRGFDFGAITPNCDGSERGRAVWRR